MHLVFLFVDGFIKIVKTGESYYISQDKNGLPEGTIEHIVKEHERFYDNVKFIDNVYTEDHTYKFLKRTICKETFHEMLDIVQLKNLIECTNKSKEMFIGQELEEEKQEEKENIVLGPFLDVNRAGFYGETRNNTKESRQSGNFKPMYTIDDSHASFVNRVYINQDIQEERKASNLYYNTFFKTIYITKDSIYDTRRFPEFEFISLITDTVKSKLEAFIVPKVYMTDKTQIKELLKIIEDKYDNSPKLDIETMKNIIEQNYEKSTTELKESNLIIQEIQNLLHINSKDYFYSRKIISKILNEMDITSTCSEGKILWAISKIDKIDYSKGVDELVNEMVKNRPQRFREKLSNNELNAKTHEFDELIKNESRVLFEREKNKKCGFGPVNTEIVPKGGFSKILSERINKIRGI